VLVLRVRLEVGGRIGSVRRMSGSPSGGVARRAAIRRGSAGLGWLGGRDQAHHPDQVVGAGDQVAGHLRFVQADIPRAAESAGGFDPPKYFLNPLTDSLADGIPRMTCGAAIDRTAPSTLFCSLGGTFRSAGRPHTQVSHPLSAPNVWGPVHLRASSIGQAHPVRRTDSLRHLKVNQKPVGFHSAWPAYAGQASLRDLLGHSASGSVRL
jgi:hypothetical protein